MASPAHLVEALAATIRTDKRSAEPLRRSVGPEFAKWVIFAGLLISFFKFSIRILLFFWSAKGSGAIDMTMSQSMHPRVSEANRFQRYGRRPNQGRASRAILSGPTPRAFIDKFGMIPILACVFAVIAFPLLSYYSSHDIAGVQARPEPRIFWPAMAAISVSMAVQNRSRLTFPPHIICLFAYLAFAGASALWAFSPGSSFTRYLQQVMIVVSIVLPTLLAGRSVDVMRVLFPCFAFALLLNLYYVSQSSQITAIYGSSLVKIGYGGYFNGKNYLGECATLAFLLSLGEIRQSGGRRAMGTIFVVISVFVIYLSDSKTAFGLALICPFLAAFTLSVRKLTRVSPAIILSTIPICFILLSSVSNLSFERLSYMLYGDSTLTGRTLIWSAVKSEIAIRPLLGWGYQSFWLVLGSPARIDFTGWVRFMPNGHNGYYDTELELGYVGLVFLLVFILATLHAVGRVADRDPRRAQLVLSLVLFVILWNFFESLWMRGFEFIWVVFVIVTAEIGRYWRPVPLQRCALSSSAQRHSGSLGFSSRSLGHARRLFVTIRSRI